MAWWDSDDIKKTIKPWWSDIPNVASVQAQQLIQRPVSTEEVYARSGLTQPNQETRPDYMPMDEIPSETVQTTPIAEDKLPEVFDPEGSDYDMQSAVAAGMKPEIDPTDGKPHWGSVIKTSKEDQEKYNLPEESYMLLKGKSHETWDKAVKGEEDRGFKIEKHGDRYFSVPQETETQGVNLDEEPIQEKLIYDDRLTPDDTTKPKAKALSTNEEFINDWGITYQTDNDPVKNKKALERLNSFNGEIKPEATTAMQVAGAIFDGDKNITSDQIIDYLTKVGIVESKFNTKKQKGGGPARSYWQVEPSTALDLSKNSKAFFGNKFNTAFKKYAKDGETAIESLSKMSKEEISQLLLDDDKLAASFAAAKYIATR